MANKVYLSPSNQDANTYAAGNTVESEQCEKIADAVAVALKRCGFEVMIGESDENMTTRCKNSNTWGADYHIPIHTNAANGTAQGTRVFVRDNKATAAINMATHVLSQLQAITLSGLGSLKEAPELIEIANADAPCVYIEVDFHDVPAVAQWIISHTTEIAEAITRGICLGSNVPYVKLNVGDPVAFTGQYYYPDKNAMNSAASTGHYGPATISAVSAGSVRTYKLKADAGTNCVVNGWVDWEDVHPLGDINMDWVVDSKDSRLALQASVGSVSLSKRQMIIGDTNGDEKIDSVDSRWILQHAVT